MFDWIVSFAAAVAIVGMALLLARELMPLLMRF